MCYLVNFQTCVIGNWNEYSTVFLLNGLTVSRCMSQNVWLTSLSYFLKLNMLAFDDIIFILNTSWNVTFSSRRVLREIFKRDLDERNFSLECLLLFPMVHKTVLAPGLTLAGGVHSPTGSPLSHCTLQGAKHIPLERVSASIHNTITRLYLKSIYRYLLHRIKLAD